MKFKTLDRKRRCVVYKNYKGSVSALTVKVVKRRGAKREGKFGKIDIYVLLQGGWG